MNTNSAQSVAAKVLREHHWVEIDGGKVCACDRDVEWTTEHQLEALEVAGFVMVELVDPDDLPDWGLGVEGGEIVDHEAGRPVAAHAAPGLAAALLTAYNMAQDQQRRGVLQYVRSRADKDQGLTTTSGAAGLRQMTVQEQAALQVGDPVSFHYRGTFHHETVRWVGPVNGHSMVGVRSPSSPLNTHFLYPENVLTSSSE